MLVIRKAIPAAPTSHRPKGWESNQAVALIWADDGSGGSWCAVDDAEGRDVEHDFESLTGHQKVEDDAEQPDGRNDNSGQR